MKRIVVFALLLMLLAPCARAEGASFEGEGYAAPEDAALAYAEAFARGDVMGMVSTFAVETYVEHFDAKAYLLDRQGYSTHYADPLLAIPLETGYGQALRVTDRASGILDSFDQQYAAMSGMVDLENEYLNPNMGRVAFRPDQPEILEEFLEAAAGCVWPGEVTAGQVLGRDLSGSVQWGDSYDKYLATVCAYAGCDEAVTVAPLLRIDGVDYLQLMVCVRYGETWYNFALSGWLGSYLLVAVPEFRNYRNACGLLPAGPALALLEQNGIDQEVK